MKKIVKKSITMLLVMSLLISNFAMIFSSAATGDYVELAFNNQFIFEKWATNSLSATIMPSAAGELSVDIPNGTFTINKTDMSAVELYTRFSMETGDKSNENAQFYMMNVKPNTSYVLSFNLSGTAKFVQPLVFFYDSSNTYISLVQQTASNTNGTNEISFTTPANATSAQVRFTVCDNKVTNSDGSLSWAYRDDVNSVSATFSKIIVYKADLSDSYYDAKNLFKFDEWAKTSSAGAGATNGTVSYNTTGETISLENTSAGYLFTAFGVSADTDNFAYYTMDIEPSTEYTITYDLVDYNLIYPNYLQPFIVELDSEGKSLTYYQIDQGLSWNTRVSFTPKNSTAEHIQLVFALITNDASEDTAPPRHCTIKNIGVYKSSDLEVSFETLTGYTYRKVYTEGAGKYGELPTPAYVPDGYVFSGWYTGEDGTGERITADTTIDYVSHTVYPKYDIAVDTLTVKTNPTKMTYTVGEKFNPAGLVLEASYTRTVTVEEDTDEDGVVDNTYTEDRVTTFTLSSGYTWEPETLDNLGTDTVTISYGGKSVDLSVNVIDSEQAVVTVNGTDTTVSWVNNEYTFNYTAGTFNRYEMTYYSDSYVKGTIYFEDGLYEDFFLEPSSNGSFASYVDKFVYIADETTGEITSNSYTQVVSIKFTTLDKEFGTVELKSLETIYVTPPTEAEAFFENANYKVGINLAYGGAVSYIEDRSNGPVAYTDSDGHTQVNFKDKATGELLSSEVNLININDRGRYLQQSYYGTSEDPFVMGDYNGQPWPYNPVQGGNILREASKIVDYRITDEGIYIKARPLDWGKGSDAAVLDYNARQPDDTKDMEAIYEDSYNTPSYMEAWYSFEGADLIRTDCRFVDYSGYPSAAKNQELPAFYTIEPLNYLYYKDTTGADKYENDLDFWGLDYADLYKSQLGIDYTNIRKMNENWAAFMAGDDKTTDFGIGLYSPGVTDFTVGTYPAKYEKVKNDDGSYSLQANSAPRYVTTADPAVEHPTSYMSPIDNRVFESYSPTSYTFYVSTGTAQTIEETFDDVASGAIEAEKEKSKIAVPETGYMQPTTDDNYTLGQYYVNNILDAGNYYNIETVAQSDDNMYFGLYVQNASSFTVNVTNVTNPDEEIILGNADGTGDYEGTPYNFTDDGNSDGNSDTFIFDNVLGLYFADGGGLAPGEMATAKWEITATVKDVDENGNDLGTTHTETYTAYTVLYAPGPTVGAVAEGRYNDDRMNEISSWITGATGVDHSRRAPLSTFHGDLHDSGMFIYDPLIYPDVSVTTNINGEQENSHDYITSTDWTVKDDNGTHESDDYSETAYVLSTATLDSDSSSAQSYLGLLAIDKSRYTNTEQIPNLKIGFDALRQGKEPYNSYYDYNTYYTLGTAEAFTSADLSAVPSNWTSPFNYGHLTDSQTIPYRETVVPSFVVSDDMNEKYIHAITRARTKSWIGDDNRYSLASTSVLISLTDKSELRDAVTEGYTKVEEDYTPATYPEYIEKLEDAATVLGDPTASQDEIDNAKNELDKATEELSEVYYTLKYDNLFGIYEYAQMSGNMTMNVTTNASITYKDGTLTVVSDNAEKTDVYAKEGCSEDHYNIDVTGGTEYVLEYDVETEAGSQVLVFFYDSNGNKVFVSADSTEYFVTSYVTKSGHYIKKFTVPSGATQLGFRFGNAYNVVNKSIFSNVRLIESAKYYEDAEYSKTEAVYKQYASYGTLITPVRTGYTFTGWKDIDGNTVTGADIATQNLSVYSQWEATDYTITYNADGGSVYPASLQYDIETPIGLPTPTKDGYTFKGWKVTTAGGNWSTDDALYIGNVAAGKYGNVTLTAQWARESFPILFDTILDFSEWGAVDGGTASRATYSNVTDNGFTLTSNADAGEGCAYSPFFEVTPGVEYTVDVDIDGTNWDVYIFFCNENGSWVEFDDTANHYSAGTFKTFTAPNNNTIVKAQIRLDANGSSNEVTFSDIRVYETGDCASDVNVPFSSMDVEYESTFGTLPVPTRNNYDFLGWYTQPNGGGTLIEADTTSEFTETTTLYSHWKARPVTDDTVVIDYGLPVKINVLVNDMANGTLNKIGTGVAEGTVINYNGYDASQLVGTGTEITLKYGTAKIVDNIIVYTPNTTKMNGEEVFYYEYNLDGKYYYATVTVIPAANIYYEESFMEFVNGGEGYEWVDIGEPITGQFQAEDRPGDFSFADYDANNVYGSDSAYDTSYTYSLGSAKKTSVDSKAYGQEPTAKFTFAGTGFDLFSVTSNQTGGMLVTIYKDGKVHKNYIVSTYYGYKVENDKLVPDTSAEDNAIYQVPVISKRDLAYGTYDVVIKPLYSSAFDPNFVENGTSNAYDVYIDSVRIFNPAGTDPNSSTITDAYLADGEYAPAFQEIRDTVLAAEDFSSTITGANDSLSGSLFLDGNVAGVVSTYKTQGPKNELYLGQNQAVAFYVEAKDEFTLASLQLGMKVVSTKDENHTAEVVVMNSNDKVPQNITVTGAHESYKKLGSAIVWDDTQAAGTYKTLYPIIIYNNSDSVVSLTAFKWAHKVDETAAVSFMVYSDTPELANSAIQNAVTYLEKPYNEEEVSIEWTDTKFTEGQEATLRIKTPAEVVKVMVGDVEVKDYETDANGNKIWTYSFVVEEAGENSYDVLLYGENGKSGDPIKTETIVVEEAESDGGDSDTDVDKATNLFAKILEFFKTIINFLWRVIA